MKYISSLFYNSMLLLLITSCGKDNNPTDVDPSICRIVSATRVSGSGTINYALTYDNNGQVNSITTTTGGVTTQKQFAFTGNVTKITHIQAGATIQIDSIVNNANGMIGYIRTRFPGGTGVTESEFIYNGTEIATFRSTINGVAGDLYTATFSNGNLITWTGGGIVQTNNYYTDQSAQPGDDLFFSQLVNYGNPYFRNRNLLQSISINNTSQVTTYLYDADGKITSARSANTGNVITTSYVYSCD